MKGFFEELGLARKTTPPPVEEHSDGGRPISTDGLKQRDWDKCCVIHIGLDFARMPTGVPVFGTTRNQSHFGGGYVIIENVRKKEGRTFADYELQTYRRIISKSDHKGTASLKGLRHSTSRIWRNIGKLIAAIQWGETV